MEFSHSGYPPDFKFRDTDFNRHRDGLFWDKRLSRQWNGPDCEMHPFFSVGGRYLMFRDKPYHWKSFERIVGDDDRWLEAVRTEVRTSGEKAGFSQTIYEYLVEKKAVYLHRIERCPKGEEEGTSLPYTRQLERIRGEEMRTRRFWPDFGKVQRPCTPGLTFLAVHYEGEDSELLIHPSAFPIEGGVVDFSNIDTEIAIVGGLRIPIQELKRRLR